MLKVVLHLVTSKRRKDCSSSCSIRLKTHLKVICLRSDTVKKFDDEMMFDIPRLYISELAPICCSAYKALYPILM